MANNLPSKSRSRNIQKQHVRKYASGKSSIINRGNKTRDIIVGRRYIPERKSKDQLKTTKYKVPAKSVIPRKDYNQLIFDRKLNYILSEMPHLTSLANRNIDDFNDLLVSTYDNLKDDDKDLEKPKNREYYENEVFDAIYSYSELGRLYQRGDWSKLPGYDDNWDVNMQDDDGQEETYFYEGSQGGVKKLYDENKMELFEIGGYPYYAMLPYQILQDRDFLLSELAGYDKAEEKKYLKINNLIRELEKEKIPYVFEEVGYEAGFHVPKPYAKRFRVLFNKYLDEEQ